MKNSVTSIRGQSSPRGTPAAAGLPFPLEMALVGCAPGALGALGNLCIAVVGCGSVGGRIALLLTRLCIGSLVLVDPKSYKAGSLATHDIGPEDVGQPKAMVVAQRCRRINPALRVLAFVKLVEALDPADLADVDLIVMAPDLLSVEMHAGQLSMWLGKPLVQASVHGPTLTIQVRFFLNARGAGPCPACGYGRAELELLARQARFSCEGASGAPAALPDVAPATNSISALCSLAADLAVIQLLRFFLKLGQPVADTILEYCGFTHRTVVSPLARNPKCTLEHVALAQAVVEVPLSNLSLAQVVQQVAGTPVAADAQFEVAGLDWVEFAACSCVQPTPVRRFVPRGHARLYSCRKCSSPLVPLSFYTHRVVSASLLGFAAEKPLNKLGARRVASMLLRTGDNGILVRHQTPSQVSL